MKGSCLMKVMALWLACLMVSINQMHGVSAKALATATSEEHWDTDSEFPELMQESVRSLLNTQVKANQVAGMEGRQLFFKKIRRGIKKGFQAIGKGFQDLGEGIKKVVVNGFDEFCEVVDSVEEKLVGLDKKIKRARSLYEARYGEYQELKKQLLAMEAAGVTPSRAWFGRLKNMRKGLDDVNELMQSLQREADEESRFCAAVRKLAKTVGKAVQDAVREVRDFIEEHKCFLIETGFAIAGEIGDAAFGVLTLGTLETQEANPICIGLVQGKFAKAFEHVTEAVDRGQTAAEAANEFSQKGETVTDIITGIPNVATPAGLLTLLFEQVQETACVLRDDLGLDFGIIDRACKHGDIATSFVTVLLNAFCGDFGSAIAEILKIAAQCAAGCNNGFCPNDHRLLIQQGSLRGQ